MDIFLRNGHHFHPPNHAMHLLAQPGCASLLDFEERMDFAEVVLTETCRFRHGIRGELGELFHKDVEKPWKNHVFVENDGLKRCQRWLF